MAYAGGTTLVLFGGYNGGYLGDTWEYDRSTHSWTQYATGGAAGITKPLARDSHAMAFAGGTKIVLFGGSTTSTILGDTWEYDTSTHAWTEQSMGYSGGSKMVLFGGWSASPLGDTWEYDDSSHTWTQTSVGGTVGVDKSDIRSQQSMGYAGGSKLVLFGGKKKSVSYGDTWEYDAATHSWTQSNVTGTAGVDKPDARSRSGMDFLGDSKVLLFGGSSSTAGDVGDTWEYDISTHAWTQHDQAGTEGDDKPGRRSGHALAYAGGSNVILFGGYHGQTLGDTWEY